jgi:hypothetical protein
MIAAADTLYDEQLDVRALVRPHRRRMAAGLIARRGVSGLAAALGGVAAIIFFFRLSPWPGTANTGQTGVLIGAYSLAVITCTGIWIALDWPSLRSAIQHADRVLGLKNRLATAYEYRERADRIIALQRSELKRLLATTRLEDAAIARPTYRQVALLGLAVVLLILAAVVPISRASSHSQTSQVVGIARKAATSTSKLLDHLGLATSPTKAGAVAQSPATEQLKQVLQTLQKQLQSAPSQQAALKVLSSAQASLQKLASGSAQAKSATQAMANALRSGPTLPVAKALQDGDAAAVRRALQALSRQLASMSAAQQAATARALEQAANSASGALKQSLRQAAFDLTDNNPAAARSALNAAANQAAQIQQQANAASIAQQAASAVQKIQSDAANGVTDNSAVNCPPATSDSAVSVPAICLATPDPGTAASPQAGSTSLAAVASPAAGGTASAGATGVATGSSVSHASSAGKNGTPGAGTSAGKSGTAGARSGASASAASSRAGTRAASGSTGKPSSSAGQGQAASASGAASSPANVGGKGGGGKGSGANGSAGAGQQVRGQTVYVPGAQLKGPGVTESGPAGSIVQVGSPSYQQMVGKYAATANAALGREVLPSSLQDAIKRYFSTLQGTK